MQNDHDDKYEPHEESEYHFSDEEVSYEVEHEPVKPSPAASQRESIIKQFTQKRLIVSSVVFVVLVFAVYKMVAGPSSVPSTDITSAPSVPVVAQTVQPIPTAPMQPAVPVQAPKNVAISTTPQMPANAITPPSAPVAPVVAQAPIVVPPPMQPAPTQAFYPPVTSTASAAIAPPVQTIITTPSGANDQALSSQATQLMAASQQAANQKIAEFAERTSNLQSEMQQLNARVMAMETQLTQLVQVLTQQQAPAQQAPTAPITAPTEQNESQAVGPEAQQETGEELATRIAYNVQAIIPGQAWLKSENGDTLTVAEGDLIKNVGRVTKIDPYDGVVEINTGNKVVSLSYGNTG